MDVIFLAILGLALDAKIFGEELLPQLIYLGLELVSQVLIGEIMLKERIGLELYLLAKKK